MLKLFKQSYAEVLLVAKLISGLLLPKGGGLTPSFLSLLIDGKCYSLSMEHFNSVTY